jgi:hypothetical protein
MITLKCPCCEADMVLEDTYRAIQIAAGDNLSPAENELVGLVLTKGPLSLEQLSRLPRAHIQKKNVTISAAFIRRAAASVNAKLADNPDLVMQVTGKVEGYSTENPLILFFAYPASEWDFLEGMQPHISQRDRLIEAEPQSQPEQTPPADPDSGTDTPDQSELSPPPQPEAAQD